MNSIIFKRMPALENSMAEVAFGKLQLETLFKQMYKLQRYALVDN